MKLCIESTFFSASSTKARTAADETPWASGVLRASGAPAFSAARQLVPTQTASQLRMNGFIRGVSSKNPGMRPSQRVTISRRPAAVKEETYPGAPPILPFWALYRVGGLSRRQALLGDAGREAPLPR